MESWDPVAFKALLRTTSQRLGQLQERKDTHSQLARRDIATYLSHGHIALARARAATLIQEEIMGDLMEELEMLVGVVASHSGELVSGASVGLGLWEDVNGTGGPSATGRAESSSGIGSKPPRVSPALVEAAASIIHAAPSTESKDLNAVREILIQRLGPSFAQTASATRNNHVSPRIMQILSSPPPTASKMDQCLAEIATTYGVKWTPELPREDLHNVISEILRVDVGSSPIVDLPRLREICARGLPDHPPWIRPRVWRLLFGTLPVLKTTWNKESQKQRDSYYDLVRRLLVPIASLPAPTNLLSPTDALLARISDSLSRVSPEVFVLLGNEPKGIRKCPLDPSAPETIRIACASNLDKRLALLKGDGDTYETPEIRLESDLNGSPDSVSSPPSSATSFTSRRQRRPTTLLPSKAYNAPPVHRAHLSALLRLLYVHSSLNPAVQSPHVPWLLVALYSALVGEVDEDDVANAEADTFWVFEALVGEISEMEEGEGGKIWMQKLSERIKWVDGELAARLHTTGLDPILPHYSYRWLAPLLVQTLPLSCVFPIWDVLFARPMRTRNANPKLEHLVDICTTLLVRARTPLFKLGKPTRNAPGLWAQEHTALPPSSPLHPWELSDAFTEGIALLSSYPVDAAGGIDRILQAASDLSQKRIEAGEKQKERERGSVGLGARIKQRMWKGFTNQVADGSPEEEVEEEEDEEETEDEDTEEHDDGNETETPAVPTLTSRLANTVWRGITNQSSMDDEIPSPPTPSSAQRSPVSAEGENSERLPLNSVQPTPSSQARLWDYAGKLKDSDTVAAFSKVSTNWRAMALDAWRVRKGANSTASTAPVPPGRPTLPSSATSDTATRKGGWPGLSDLDAPSHRRESLPGAGRENGDPDQDPPRPAFFRSPRESFLPQPRRQDSTATPSPSVDQSAQRPRRDSDTESSASSLIHRAGASIASLTPFSPSHSMSKTPLRPLMLSARDRTATQSPRPQPFSSTRSEGGTPEHRGGAANQWGELISAAKNRRALRQGSISSASSLSPSEVATATKSPRPFPSTSAGTGSRSDHESDESAAAASRRVLLNRKSVSPMALASRSPRLPWNAAGGHSPGSGHPLSSGGSVTLAETDMASELGWEHVEVQGHPGASAGAGATPATGFDSPTTIGSPPIPRTPVMPIVPGAGVVRIVNGGQHVGTSSISTLSEVGEANKLNVAVVPIGPPPQHGLVVHKTPPVTSAFDGNGNEGEDSVRGTSAALESEAEESDLSLDRTPSGKAPVRLRSKRYVPRPVHLHLRPAATGTGPGLSESQARSPSPMGQRLTPEELATTPKMDSYLGRVMNEEREAGAEWEGFREVLVSRPPFVRKLSKETRLRKISTGSRETRRARDSGAEEGDDEGYDELLSAYESEEGSRE